MPMDPPEGPGTVIRTCRERQLIRSDADLLVGFFLFFLFGRIMIAGNRADRIQLRRTVVDAVEGAPVPLR